MPNKLTVLSLTLCLLILSVKTDSCSAVIQDAINYLATPEPGYTHTLGFQLTTVKAPAKFISYSSGLFNTQVLSVLPITRYLRADNIKILFSDRAWCPEQPSGLLFCAPYQPFDYRKADTIQVSLYSNSTAKIVLNTWGNASFQIPLDCQNGFLSGTMM